jgi:RHS repeat-associated protein
MGFKPWGELRFGASPTQYQYTGQYREPSLGIDFFNAHGYDPALGRFLSADTLVPNPGYPGDFDRYSYARNSPLVYVDPSGHLSCSNPNAADGDCVNLTDEEILSIFYNVVFSDGWTDEYIHIVLMAVRFVGDAFQRAGEGFRGADDAFRAAYGLNDGGTFYFEWDEDCWGCRADP